MDERHATPFKHRELSVCAAGWRLLGLLCKLFFCDPVHKARPHRNVVHCAVMVWGCSKNPELNSPRSLRSSAPRRSRLKIAVSTELHQCKCAIVEKSPTLLLMVFVSFISNQSPEASKYLTLCSSYKSYNCMIGNANVLLDKEESSNLYLIFLMSQCLPLSFALILEMVD